MPINDVPYKLHTEATTSTTEYTSTVTTQDNRKEWGIVKKMRFYRKAVKWLWKHRAEDNNRHKWRRVEEQLPEPGQDVLVYTYFYGRSIYAVAWLDNEGKWSFGTVTHWMPIEPPKED